MLIILTKIINAVYPPVCGICGKPDKNSLCNKCKMNLQKQSVCQIEDYKNTTSFFDEHIYMFLYSGQIRDTILNYKFNDKSYLYKTFVNFLKNSEKMCVQIEKYDIIIPIPISRQRLKQRGYNQSAILARNIANVLKKQYNKNILIKVKDNMVQSALKQEERTKNVQNVYKIINKEKIVEKKVLLVDDIFTTGSTVNECSKILKKAGVKEVGVFTVAKD